MKKQTIIQIKETLSSSFPPNIKLHLISWVGDNLLDDIDSCIEATHATLSCPYYHSEHIICWGDSLGL
ncbi:MAG: hypothetical protein ACTS73_04840 [Arsenophonus sp. NEOnobi-MAG3]